MYTERILIKTNFNSCVLVVYSVYYFIVYSVIFFLNTNLKVTQFLKCKCILYTDFTKRYLTLKFNLK